MADTLQDSEKKRSDSFVEDVLQSDGSVRQTRLDDLTPQQRAAVDGRKLVRKLDIRFLPTVVLIFIMNYIDVRPMPSQLVKAG